MLAKQAELQQLRTASHSSKSHCINQGNSSIRSIIMISQLTDYSEQSNSS